MLGVRIDNALQNASVGLKFKATLPESVTKVLLAQATEKLKGMNPEYIDDGNGGKVLVFQKADGARELNPNNDLKPYTATELLQRELEAMDVLEKQRKQTGSGTEPPTRGGGGSEITLDVSGARTQREADDIIAKQLMAQGITKGSQEFQDAKTKTWNENNIKNLPFS